MHYRCIVEKSLVSLKVYDLSGRLVRELVHEEQKPGIYNVSWDGLYGNFERVQNGVYFYRLEVENYTITKKMILMR